MEFQQYLQPCSAGVDLQRCSVYSPMTKPLYVLSNGIPHNHSEEDNPPSKFNGVDAPLELAPANDVITIITTSCDDDVTAETPESTPATTSRLSVGRGGSSSSGTETSKCSWSCGFDDEVGDAFNLT